MNYKQVSFKEIQEVCAVIDPLFVYSDLHINRRFGGLDYLSVVEDFYTSIRQFKGEHLFLGDLFHNAKPAPSEIKSFMDHIPHLPRTHFLEGNHTVAASNEPTIVEALSDVISDRHELYTQPDSRLIDVPSEGGEAMSVNFIFIPYSKRLAEDGYIQSIIREHHKNGVYNIGLYHGAMDGSLSNTGDALFNVGVKVNDEVFAGLDFVLAGDFHRHQFVKTGGNIPVLYVGSPSQMSFGDTFDPQVGILFAKDKELHYWSFNPSEMDYKPLTFYTVEALESKSKHAFHLPLDSNLSVLQGAEKTATRVIYDRGNEGAILIYNKLKSSVHESSRIFDHGYNDNVKVSADKVDFTKVNTPELWLDGFKEFAKDSLFDDRGQKDYYMSLIDELYAEEDPNAG